MTLFEVDEAATRIREEVDQDANIILGATFDESLEGIIRVSVVATGIEAAAAEIGNNTTELRAQPRPAVAARPMPAQPQAPAATAPVAKEEPVSEVIRETERDMAAFEEKAAAATAQSKPEFRPQSKLFTGAQQPMRATPATAPIAAKPQPEAIDDEGANHRACRASKTFRRW
jgi:cell division protein FtsZ